MFDLSDHCYLAASFRIEGEEQTVESNNEWVEYYKVKDDDAMRTFVTEVENRIEREEGLDLEKFEDIVQMTAERCLKRRVRRKINKKGKVEPPWINDEIKREIKERKRVNRERRNASADRKQQLWEDYKKQKGKVKTMVRKYKSDYEKKVAKEVKENKGKGKMWKMIRKLRGESERDSRRCKLYENGLEVEDGEENEKMLSCWKEIYQSGENKILEVWNEKRQEYRREWERVSRRR